MVITASDRLENSEINAEPLDESPLLTGLFLTYKPLMSILTIFFVVLVIVIIILIVIYLSGGFTPYATPSLTPNFALSQYKIPSPWSSPIASTDAEGVCRLYTFTGSNHQPVGPKYSTLAAGLANNTCKVLNKDQTCRDVDQVYAQKVSHICQVDKGPTGGTGCLKQDGTRARAGESEVYFRACNNQSSACGGTLALINLTFNPATFRSGDLSTSQCLNVTNATLNPDKTYSANVVSASCDISDINQLLRIERFSLKSDGSLSVDSSGLLARISHRQSGACLAPTLNPSSKGTYDPTNYEATGALSLVSCNTGSLSGVWWGLSQPTPAPDKSSTSPQQIVYIPDITKLPDLSNATSVWTFLQSTKAIQNTVESGRPVTMRNFNTGAAGTGSSDATNNQNNTQYIDYGLYNLIVNSGLSNYPF